jgi:hypothetical protein
MFIHSYDLIDMHIHMMHVWQTRTCNALCYQRRVETLGNALCYQRRVETLDSTGRRYSKSHPDIIRSCRKKEGLL